MLYLRRWRVLWNYLCLFVLPSVCLSVKSFSREPLTSFFCFYMIVDKLSKTDRVQFFEKIHFVPKWAQNGLNSGFFKFLKTVCHCTGLGGKLKFILLALYLHQPHIWEHSGAWVVSQNSLSQWDCMILRSAISQEKSGESTWF